MRCRSSGLQAFVHELDVCTRLLSALPRNKMVMCLMVCVAWHRCVKSIHVTRMRSLASNMGLTMSPERRPQSHGHSHAHAAADTSKHTQVGIVIVKATAHTIMTSWELDFSNVPIFRNVVSIAGRGCFDAFIVRLNQEFHFLAPIPRVTYLDASHSIQPLDTERDFAKALYAAVTSHDHNLNVFITAMSHSGGSPILVPQSQPTEMPPVEPLDASPVEAAVITTSLPSAHSITSDPPNAHVVSRHFDAASIKALAKVQPTIVDPGLADMLASKYMKGASSRLINEIRQNGIGGQDEISVGPQVEVQIEQACSSSSNSSECDLEEPMTASPTHSYDGAAPETYDVEIPHAHSHATTRNQTEVGVVIVKATSSNMMSSWELDFSNVPMFRVWYRLQAEDASMRSSCDLIKNSIFSHLSSV